MILNQQTPLLHGTENREQRTMILIQGKRDIYFKYFCRMTEAIYSVIIRHIVKWTIAETVTLAGSGVSEEALLPCVLCSTAYHGLSVGWDGHWDCIHFHLEPERGIFLLGKLWMQVFKFGNCLAMRWKWLGSGLWNGNNFKVLHRKEEIVYASIEKCSGLSGLCHLGVHSQTFRELITITRKSCFLSQRVFVEGFLRVRTWESLMSTLSAFPWRLGTLQGGR